MEARLFLESIDRLVGLWRDLFQRTRGHDPLAIRAKGRAIDSTIMPKRSAHRFPRCRFPHPRRTIPTCRYHPSSVGTERCTGYTAIMPHRLAHRFASCRFPQPGRTIAARGELLVTVIAYSRD